MLPSSCDPDATQTDRDATQDGSIRAPNPGSDPLAQCDSAAAPEEHQWFSDLGKAVGRRPWPMRLRRQFSNGRRRNRTGATGRRSEESSDRLQWRPQDARCQPPHRSTPTSEVRPDAATQPPRPRAGSRRRMWSSEQADGHREDPTADEPKKRPTNPTATTPGRKHEGVQQRCAEKARTTRSPTTRSPRRLRAHDGKDPAASTRAAGEDGTHGARDPPEAWQRTTGEGRGLSGGHGRNRRPPPSQTTSGRRRGPAGPATARGGPARSPCAAR